MHDSNGHLDNDTLAAHAVDALPPEEVVEAGAHLATCARCQQELASLRAAAALLPHGLAIMEPPPELRDRILARARASRPDIARDDPAPVSKRRSGWTWLPRLAPALAVLTLLLGFFLGRYWPAGQAPDRPGPAEERSVALTGRGGGTFVVAPGHGRVRLLVEGLPQLDEDHVYQLWLLGGSAPVSAGVFTVDAAGRAELEIRGFAWSSGYNGVAITAEPRGGSPGPTTDIIAKGGF